MKNMNPWEIIEALFYTMLITIVASLPLMLMPVRERQPEELKAARLELPRPSLELPDVSIAFEIKEAREKTKAILDEAREIKTKIDTVEFPKVTTKLTSLGTYYITGYTSVECGGSTTTASGTTCHKAASVADSINNPTTCAIDPALHDFGDVFFLESFGYFIAEDTGSAVKGKHLDLYFWDHEYGYALSITGYYTVYAVEYIEGTYQPGDYDIRKQVADKVIGWKIKGT